MHREDKFLVTVNYTFALTSSEQRHADYGIGIYSYNVYAWRAGVHISLQTPRSQSFSSLGAIDAYGLSHCMQLTLPP